MSKSNKFLTTILLGAAGGAAAAVFLASKSGKVVKQRVAEFFKDYQEDPESKHTEWADKAKDFKNQTIEKYSDVRHKFETGQLTPDDIVESVKEKAVELKDRLSQEEFFTNLKEHASKIKSDVAEIVDEIEAATEELDDESISEEITIDLEEADLFTEDVVVPESEVLENLEKANDDEVD